MPRNWSGGVWDGIGDPAGSVVYLHLSFSWKSHSQPHFAPCWQPSGWFWELPAILHHGLGPVIIHEHMVLCSAISIGLENKPRWLERQAIWRKEKKLGPNSRKKLSWECSALLSGFTGTGGFKKIEAVAVAFAHAVWCGIRWWLGGQGGEPVQMSWVEKLLKEFWNLLQVCLPLCPDSHAPTIPYVPQFLPEGKAEVRAAAALMT